MCDPISIAGVALSGASMAANSIAANQVSAATNAAEQQNEMLNQVQQQRAFTAEDQALNKYRGFAAGQSAMGTQLGDFLKAGSTGRAAPVSNMAPTGASTAAAVASGAPSVAAYGNQQAGALGNLNSFGDYLAQQNRLANRDQQTANQATDFMRGNDQVLNLQLNDAQHAGDTASMFGSLFGSLGNVGTKAGLSGAWGVPGYGNLLTHALDDDATYSEARNAGLTAGMVSLPDGSVDWADSSNLPPSMRIK